jgi:HEAT repeat protein
VNALGLLKAEQAVEQIDACLNDSTPIVVQAAILTMARIDPPRTVFR